MTDEKIYSYVGKILGVNLSTGVISTRSSMDYARKWLGQRGIGQRILYEELKPWVTPYEPANVVVVETGPLTGTLAPCSCRYSLASKNPFSGGVGTSNSCGFFGPELKFAGYDHIVIQGRSNKPVYLWIENERVEIRDADFLWGKTTWETEELIREELGDVMVQVSCIGPAGENLARGACVIANRNRAAGKCGLGGILGSKNLKAIAVRGTKSIEVAEPERFMNLVSHAWEKIAKSVVLQRYGKYGTIGGMKAKNEFCSMPYKNFQETCLPEKSMAKLDPEIFYRNYKVKDMAYMACPVHCSKFYRIDDGPYAGLETEGFQLNTMADYAAKCGIDYPAAIIKAHTLCNQLGVDVDAAAGAISWAFECYQRGIITEKDSDGLRLEWGDYNVVMELIRKIAYRDGFGDLLAEGCKKASEILGRESGYFAIHLKGQDLYEEIRAPVGWGLGTCVATRGGGHTTGAPACEITMSMDSKMSEVCKRVFGIKNVNPQSYDDKAELVQYFEREQELVNSLGLCMFIGTWIDANLLGIPELAEIYSAATGWETTEDEIIMIADRILNLEKAFNVLHAGLGRKDDLPPERCLTEPITAGKYDGFVYSEEKWNKMLDHYYRLHGWDPKTGLPSRSLLEGLGLEDVARDLEI
jgi:aldehyde:ferredoxin oxidoreductase